MRSTCLRLLLVVSIVLQSFIAVADVEKPHQVNAQHLQTIHSHDVDNIGHTDNLDSEHNIEDCHHCGHCQGTHTQWIDNATSAETATAYRVSNQYLYVNHLDKSLIEDLTRPPIYLI